MLSVTRRIAAVSFAACSFAVVSPGLADDAFPTHPVRVPLAPSLFSKLNYDPMNDFSSAALIGQSPMILTVNPNFAPTPSQIQLPPHTHAQAPRALNAHAPGPVPNEGAAETSRASGRHLATAWVVSNVAEHRSILDSFSHRVASDDS